MLRQVFKEIKKKRRITATAISKATGISQKHISEYINGKRDVTSETLWRMVEAMEKLSPGALADFTQNLAGSQNEGTVIRRSSYKNLPADELAEEVIRLGKALKGALNEDSPMQPLSTVGS